MRVQVDRKWWLVAFVLCSSGCAKWRRLDWIFSFMWTVEWSSSWWTFLVVQDLSPCTHACMVGTSVGWIFPSEWWNSNHGPRGCSEQSPRLYMYVWWESFFMMSKGHVIYVVGVIPLPRLFSTNIAQRVTGTSTSYSSRFESRCMNKWYEVNREQRTDRRAKYCCRFTVVCLSCCSWFCVFGWSFRLWFRKAQPFTEHMERWMKSFLSRCVCLVCLRTCCLMSFDIMTYSHSSSSKGLYDI